MNTFQGGAIYWSPATGAHVVYGGIGASTTAWAGPSATGCRPLTRPACPACRASASTLPPRPALVWSAATGAHLVYGAIGAEYAATAGETDAYGTDVQRILGAPTSDEMNVPGVPGARMNTFQGGAIYWSPATGAHVVYGGIGAKYAQTANTTNALGTTVQNTLGLPTSDEMNIPGSPAPE